jgi:caa(3)-type oxidase subunit IV
MSYFQVFLILLVVTIAEVAVTFVPMPKALLILMLIAMALYKAVMVAYHFMHLKLEKRLMWLVASAPLFLGVLITIGSYPDSEKGTRKFKTGELRPYEVKSDGAPAGGGAGDSAGGKH